MLKSPRPTRALPSIGLAAALLFIGCDKPADTSTKESVPFDPDKAKSQEDMMKKAMPAPSSKK